jgi:hypothetical protein
MGGSTYSLSSRNLRASSKGYSKATVASMGEIFEQKRKREAHESMRSQGISLREARDSDVHPNTFPVILGLDVTGSMHTIPVMLIKDGLPKIVSQIIQAGVKDVTLLFAAIGDHKWDKEPLQIGQFESGDEELDLWLSRTYPEGGGGANEGESYGLLHNFAAHNIITDAWEKRKQKGVLIMIGDEPSLDHYPANVMKEITGNPQAVGFTQDEILEKVKEKWHVFHINPHAGVGFMGRDDSSYWKPKLQQNYIALTDYEKVPETVVKIVCEYANQASVETPSKVDKKDENNPTEDEEMKDSISFIR